MIPHKSLSLISLALAALCLAAGFAAAGNWAALPVILLWFAAGWYLPKTTHPWGPSLLLAAAVCLAGFGVLSGASSLLMIFGAAAALALWDLMQCEQTEVGDHPNPLETRLWNSHLRRLPLAIGSGLIVAALGTAARLQIPFGVMALLVVLAFLALDWLARGFKDRGSA